MTTKPTTKPQGKAPFQTGEFIQLNRSPGTTVPPVKTVMRLTDKVSGFEITKDGQTVVLSSDSDILSLLGALTNHCLRSGLSIPLTSKVL